MRYAVLARNIFTGEEVDIDTYDTEKEAKWCIANNIEYDEDDSPENWDFEILELEDDDYDISDEDFALEVGFDPYEGCYTFDC